MTTEASKELLKKYLSSGQKAARWLERSYSLCQQYPLTGPISDSTFDHYENLSSRIARLSDILLQKIFRLIDQILLENPGSILDIINRAEKRGLCVANTMRNIRELRNAIAHDYTEDNLLTLFAIVQKNSQELLEIFRKTENFVETQILSLG